MHGAGSAVPTRSGVAKSVHDVGPHGVGTAERALCQPPDASAAFAHPTPC